MFKLNPWVLLGLTLAILSAVGVIYAKGRYDEAKSCSNASLKATNANLGEAIEIRNRQNEIRNNRPDNDALINSLLDGSF